MRFKKYLTEGWVKTRIVSIENPTTRSETTIDATENYPNGDVDVEMTIGTQKASGHWITRNKEKHFKDWSVFTKWINKDMAKKKKQGWKVDKDKSDRLIHRK